MRKIFSSKKLAAVAVAAVAVTGTGVAYAYWTTTGSGTGGATAGDVDPITVNQTNTVTGLYPGQDPQGLEGDFTNLNPGPVYIASVTASVTDVTGGGTDGDLPACTTDDFAIGGTATVGTEVASGTDVGGWSGLTVQLVNGAANQDNCKGASPVITYAAQ